MIIETVRHKLYDAIYGRTTMFDRWSVHPNIIIGGSILDQQDWDHLRDDLKVGAVLNVETEHSDAGYGIANLCEAQVPDDHQAFPFDKIRQALVFANEYLTKNPTGILYVHCQMGGSRSPALAYGVLRYHYGIKAGAALDMIRKGGRISNYGDHPAHQNYIGSIEKYLPVKVV